MSIRQKKLTKAEIAAAFGPSGPEAQVRSILSPAQLAEVLGLSPKTIYEWLAKGRLDGAYRKRGKHILIWRDRALDRIFNAQEWNE